ncbi:hypothetical protein MRX96_039386 [Rhipicephalus microplus]
MENYEPPTTAALDAFSSVPGAGVPVFAGRKQVSNGDVEGYVHLHNPHLAKLGSDHLYHLALSTTTHSLVDMFGDVKHGMGAPSMSILLHEVFKLLHYARCRDVLMFRIGTSGGVSVSVPPGSVVVSTGVVNGLLREEVDMHVLGKLVSRPTKLDVKLAEEIASRGPPLAVRNQCGLGKDNVYRRLLRKPGPDERCLLRLHGPGGAAVPGETTLRWCGEHRNGGRPFCCLLCHRAGIKGAVVCGIFQDRLKTERATEPQSVITEWQLRSQHVVLCFIQHRLATAGSSS